MTLQNQVEEKVAECICKAEDVFRGKIIPMIPIDFNMRGKSGGQFRCKIRRNWATNTVERFDHRLRFNNVLMHENADEYLNQVVPHEVAHYIVALRYPTAKAHGREWKDMMTMVMGKPATTTHNMDTSQSRRRVRRFVYKCECQMHEIATPRHKKMSIGFGSYRCKRCKTSLSFTGQSFYK